jgi:hypothetical protein
MPIGHEKQNYIPRSDIALQIGYVSQTQAKCMAASFSNATAILVVAGIGIFPITWQTLGADVNTLPDDAWGVDAAYPPVAPTEAGFIGHVTVTGLNALTNYTWTLTQTGGADTTGSFYSKPDDAGTTPFSIWMISCDNTRGGGGAAVGGYAEGGYDHISDYIKDVSALPLVAVIHPDDIGYCGTSATLGGGLNDYLGGDSSRTGLANYGPASFYLTEFCAAFPHFNRMNLLGPDTALNIPANWYAEMAPPSDQSVQSMSGYARDYVYRNCSMIFSWGDWEVKNNMGFHTDPMDVSGSPSPRAIYDNARSFWNKWFVPLMPSDFNVRAPDNTGGIAPTNYTVDYGPVRISSYDGVTNGSDPIPQDRPSHTDPVVTMTDLIGSNQILDMLDTFQSDHKFKFMMAAHGVGSPIAPQGEINSGPQHSLKQYCPNEFDEIFTGSGLTTISNSAKTNGTDGHFGSFGGDTHYGMVMEHIGIDENFNAFYIGTINASGGHPRNNWQVGDEFEDGKAIFKSAPDENGVQTSSIRVDVYPGVNSYIKVHMYGSDSGGNDGLLETFILTGEQDTNIFSKLSEIDMANLEFRNATAITGVAKDDKMGIDDISAPAGSINRAVTPLQLNEYVNGVAGYAGQGYVDSFIAHSDHAALVHGYNTNGLIGITEFADIAGNRNIVIPSGAQLIPSNFGTYFETLNTEHSVSAGSFEAIGTDKFMAFFVMDAGGSGSNMGLGSWGGPTTYDGYNCQRQECYLYPSDSVGGNKYVSYPAMGGVSWNNSVQAFCIVFDSVGDVYAKHGRADGITGVAKTVGVKTGAITTGPAPSDIFVFASGTGNKFLGMYIYKLTTSAIPIDGTIANAIDNLIATRGALPPVQMKDLT